MPTHLNNSQHSSIGRADIAASRLFDLAVAAHPNPLVQLLGGLAAPLVQAQFTEAFGPGTFAGKCVQVGVIKLRNQVDAKLAGMSSQPNSPVFEPRGTSRVKQSRGKSTGNKKTPKAYAVVDGRRVKLHKVTAKDRAGWMGSGQVIDIEPEVIK